LEIIVPDDQLSLAIGKKGQNVRLAARLIGWKIDIKSETRAEEADAQELEEGEAVEGEMSADDLFSAPKPSEDVEPKAADEEVADEDLDSNPEAASEEPGKQ
jgi:transcription termination/antitermination protein NusA